jgi:hypothetical protein
MRKLTPTANASIREHARAHQETGERSRGLPVAGMPLDIVLAVDRLPPEKIVEVRRLVSEIREATPPHGYASYSEDDIERLRTLVSELERDA